MVGQSILFSAPMIRALLAGRKTQTRRLAEPRWAAGDLVWVREAHHITEPGHVIYRANWREDARARGFDSLPDDEADVRWRPSIHMHRRSSRLTLRITVTRQERLQNISYEDCRDEGATCTIHGDVRHVACMGLAEGYRRLWESINGPGSWAVNPMVWVTSFEVIHSNIDAMDRVAA